MTSSPQPQGKRRALRVQLPNIPQVTIRFEDGQHLAARLQTVSVTGGLLRVLKPLNPGAVVEVMFCTHAGPVLGRAELLSPCSAVRIGLQPFRFTAVDKCDLRTLRIAIVSAARYPAELRTDRAEKPWSVNPLAKSQTGRTFDPYGYSGGGSLTPAILQWSVTKDGPPTAPSINPETTLRVSNP
ncbi:MAG: hypothetical protein WBV69_10660 [Candidatus Sulfotelmatobacter sp.]